MVVELTIDDRDEVEMDTIVVDIDEFNIVVFDVMREVVKSESIYVE